MVLNTISGEVLNACTVPIEAAGAAVERVDTAEPEIEIHGNTIRLPEGGLQATVYSGIATGPGGGVGKDKG